VTFSKYVPVSTGDRDAVIAVDMNFNWEVYKEIASDMEILSHYFIVDLEGMCIQHSKILPGNFKVLSTIS